MSIEKPADERLELYNRFKEALASGDAENEFFDADDLVIIIDQAVDLDDDYVQIEALMRGYRFFPDNEELASRRAFLYFDLNLDTGVKNLMGTAKDDSPLWDILQLRMKETTQGPEQAKPLLNALLARTDKFDDETIIQLIDCAAACGLYDWLKANEQALRDHTDYLPTLLYELFIVADMQPDYEYGLKMLEELTEIEPFNIDFWNAMAQTQSHVDDLDGAMASLDYALAIDSQNAAALTLKASILIRRKEWDKALECIAPVMENEPTSLAADIEARALYKGGREDEAMTKLVESCRRWPDDRPLMELALWMQPMEIAKLLDLHYDATAELPAETVAPWADWARETYVHGHLDSTVEILSCMRRHGTLDYNGLKMLATALYCGEMYLEAARLLDDAIYGNGEDGVVIMPDLVVAGLLSLMQLDQRREARVALNRVLAAMPMQIKDDWTLNGALASMGFGSFISTIDSMITSRRQPSQWPIFGMFNFPASYNDDDYAEPDDE